MKLPHSLLQRIELYKRTGRVRFRAGELFTDLSWFYIFEGVGMTPESYDPLMDVVKMDQLRDILGSMAQSNALAAEGVPSHDSYFSAAADVRCSN
jgi:tryptophan halogenase